MFKPGSQNTGRCVEVILYCAKRYEIRINFVLCDPNRFGGDVKVWTTENQAWQRVEPVGRSDVQRGIGVADMARAIVANEPHRASGELAFHVLDAMQAFDESAAQQKHIALSSEPVKPAVFV